jgi:hypothetical protein
MNRVLPLLGISLSLTAALAAHVARSDTKDVSRAGARGAEPITRPIAASVTPSTGGGAGRTAIHRGVEIEGDGVDNDDDPRTDDNGCTWGSRDCTRSVEDVEGQLAGFGSLTGRERRPPNGRFTFVPGVRAQLPGLDRPLDVIDGEGGHIQGFARIPGLGDEDWLVMSRSNERGRPAGLLLARLEDVPGRNGDRLVARPEDRDLFWHDTPQPADPPRYRGARAYVHIPETRHPGGIQVIGHLVAVPSYCNAPSCDGKAFVDFYDSAVCSRNPRDESCLVNRMRLDGGLLVPDDKAYHVAVTRLQDRRYVMVVNRSNAGLVDSYISSTITIDRSTRWLQHRRHWTSGFRNGFHAYQNVNFVTECTTRRSYMLGFTRGGPPGSDTNLVDLFQVEIGDGSLDIRRTRQARYLAATGGSCEMEGGASVYVTPHGEMLVYCSQSHTRAEQDPRFLGFAEYTSATNGPGIGGLDGVHQPSVPGFMPLARSVARPARERE